LSQITILINIFSFIFFVGACYQLVAAVAVRIKSMADKIRVLPYSSILGGVCSDLVARFPIGG